MKTFSDRKINEKLNFFRMTKQRRFVLTALNDFDEHPTANEVYEKAKTKHSNIALATVYNCLESMSNAGLIRQVNFDRGPTRFCSNGTKHAHFQCQKCSKITDIDIEKEFMDKLKQKASDVQLINEIEISYKGLCKKCSK